MNKHEQIRIICILTMNSKNHWYCIELIIPKYGLYDWSTSIIAKVTIKYWASNKARDSGMIWYLEPHKRLGMMSLVQYNTCPQIPRRGWSWDFNCTLVQLKMNDFAFDENCVQIVVLKVYVQIVYANSQMTYTGNFNKHQFMLSWISHTYGMLNKNSGENKFTSICWKTKFLPFGIFINY